MLRGMAEMTCPECRSAGVGGAARIGNRRKDCTLCNRFAARVRSRLNTRLRETHDEEKLRDMREQIEREVYAEFEEATT